MLTTMQPLHLQQNRRPPALRRHDVCNNYTVINTDKVWQRTIQGSHYSLPRYTREDDCLPIVSAIRRDNYLKLEAVSEDVQVCESAHLLSVSMRMAGGQRDSDFSENNFFCVCGMLSLYVPCRCVSCTELLLPSTHNYLRVHGSVFSVANRG